MNPSPPPSLAVLLAQSDWVTALCRALVADTADADDVAQATWLDVLRAPPADAPRDVRAWLATIVRRQWSRLRRGRRRRTDRELAVASAAAAATEPVATPAQLTARVQMHRELVDAVLALEEPYRTPVVLRFFEHLEPPAIAVRLGAPLATVRSRLQRAMRQLRERLDGAPGGRERWLPAVVVLARRPLAGELAATAAGIGIVAGVPMKKLLIAVGALVLALFVAVPLWWQYPVAPPSPVPAPVPSVAATPPAPAPANTPPAPDAAPAAPRAADRLAATQPARRLVDRFDQPLADVVLRAESPFAVHWQGGDRGWIQGDDRGLQLSAEDELRLQQDRGFADRWFAQFAHPDEWRATILGAPLPARDTKSARDGAFTFAPDLDVDDARIVVADPRYVLLRAGRTRGEPWRAGPAARVEGTVRDENGAPLPDAFVTALLPSGGGTPFAESIEVRTDEQGRYLVRRALARGLLQVAHDGFATAQVGVGDAPQQRLDITLTRHAPADRRELDGTIADAGGRPIAGAQVWFGRQQTRSDRQGRFVLAADEPQAEQALTVLAPGFAPLQRDRFGAQLVADRRAGRDVLLVLTEAAPPLLGIVRNASGAPLAGALVRLVDATLLDLSFQSVEARLGDFDSAVTTDADGRFVLRGLVDRSYRVRAIDPATGASREATARPGGDELLLQLPAVRALRGQLQGGDGDFTGFTVEVGFVLHVTKGGGTLIENAPAVPCSRDGRFTLPAAPRDGAWLAVRRNGSLRAMLPVEAVEREPVLVDLTGPRWLQLVGSRSSRSRPIEFEGKDGRRTPATSNGKTAQLAADGSAPPLPLPVDATAVWIAPGERDAVRLPLTDDLAVHLRVR